MQQLIHKTAIIDEGSEIGRGTHIWHHCHVMSGVKVGNNCNIGENVFLETGVVLGDGVKVKNNVALYAGVECEDDVFLGPNCVFTNVINPRSFIQRKNEFRKTRVCKGATIGANATVICGNKIGEYAMVGAGAVVTKEVPAYTVVVGNPARFHAYVCRCGCILDNNLHCMKCKAEYRFTMCGEVELVKNEKMQG